MEAILRKIGLSDGEIRIYETLLASGSLAVNEIHERVGIERRNIYDILNKLITRGIITYVTENKRRRFSIAHPSKLIGYLNERELELERTKQAVETQMQSLLAQYAATRPEIDAEVFRGEEGMKAAWDVMLDAKEIYWIGSGRYTPKQFPQYFAAWNRTRVKRKITMNNLLRAELAKEITQPYELEKVRFLPPEFSTNPIVIGVFGDRVGQYVYGKELFVFVITSKALAENYRQYYRYLWGLSTPLRPKL